jgi:hypothetical protein
MIEAGLHLLSYQINNLSNKNCHVVDSGGRAENWINANTKLNENYGCLRQASFKALAFVDQNKFPTLGFAI